MEERRVRQMDVDEMSEEEQLRREQIDDERREERKHEDRDPRPQPNSMDERLEPMFEDAATQKFRSRWLSIQSQFVDDPRNAVKQADELVADIIKTVTMNFSDRRVDLEKQWNSGENVDTEDMRLALKRYRSFFERLLTLES